MQVYKGKTSCAFVLGETNVALREEMDALLRKQYEAATKSLRSTGQQLASSQQMIQVNPSSWEPNDFLIDQTFQNMYEDIICDTGRSRAAAPHGPNIGAFFYLNTKLLAPSLYENRQKLSSSGRLRPWPPGEGSAPDPFCRLMLHALAMVHPSVRITWKPEYAGPPHLFSLPHKAHGVVENLGTEGSHTYFSVIRLLVHPLPPFGKSWIRPWSAACNDSVGSLTSKCEAGIKKKNIWTFYESESMELVNPPVAIIAI